MGRIHKRPTVLALIASTTIGSLAILTPSASADFTGQGPEPSEWVGTAQLAPLPEVTTNSDGDLWPTCWSTDGSLYSAWGDGHGFGEGFVDIGVAKISGESPSKLSGENLAVGDQVLASPWNTNHTRKPTGMACVGNTLYLAVQDLAFDFNQAPAATIVSSRDGGRTWTVVDTKSPMFSEGVFTTIWFADFGQGGSWNESRYLYAYGLDNNWRGQQEVFLARVPKDKVGERRHWEFFTGTKADTGATWSKKIEQKVPVMADRRLNYPYTFIDSIPSQEGGIVSQGGTLYNKPLDRYIMSTWSWGAEYVNCFWPR